jgi:two-component system cell cycle sensor histidine kinase/response regulator CckA
MMPGPAAAPAGGELEILIVEDDEGTAELERRALARAGKRVRIVGLVATALAALEEQSFGAILLDYQLPDGSPWAVFDAARRAAPPIPVILVTAGGDERIAAEVLRRGGADYVIKTEGFWEQLGAAVDRVIRLARIEQANVRLVAMVESSEDAIINRSLEGEILTWNAGAERIFGYSAEEAVGRPVTLLVPADRAEEETKIMQRLRAGLATRQFETLRRRKDGSLVDVSVTVSPILGGVDRQATSGADITRDISERRRIERGLAIRNEITRVTAEAATLAEAAPAFLRVLGEGLGYPSGAMWIGEPDHQEVRRVDAWERRRDGPASPPPSSRPRADFPAAVWNRQAVTFLVDEFGGDDGPGNGVLIPVLSRGQARGVIELRGRPAARPHPSAAEWLLVVGSQVGQFVEKCLASDQLRESEEQLRQAQKMEAIGQLAGGIAHDFNNLLSVINGYTELLLERLDPEAYGYRQIAEIDKAGARASGLTRQLLAFSRQRETEMRVLELNSIIGDMTELLDRLIGEHIELVTDLSEVAGRVRADANQLEQVVMNLVVNARDAMSGGGRLSISTANVTLGEKFVAGHLNMKPGPYVRLTVEDTGTGMDAATQARIFEPFFTTKEVGRGTGLGLATVFGIIQQCSGHIYVHSELGQGSTFEVYLPRVEAAVSPARSAARAEPKERGSETLLVVEDEAQLRTLICLVLEDAGYTTLEAAGPEQALEIAADAATPVDMLITDVVMPGKEGPALAAEIAKLRPGIKALFVSGYAGRTVAKTGGLDPKAAFLEKPFTSRKLLSKVREVLAAKPA